MQEGAVLGRAHVEAFKSLGIRLGEANKGEITEEVAEELDAAGLPDGIRTDEDDEDRHWLVIEGIADKKEIKDWLKAAIYRKTPNPRLTKRSRAQRDVRQRGRKHNRADRRCAKTISTSALSARS